MKIRIVSADANADMGLGVQDFDSFEAAEAAGFTKTDRVGAAHLRAELRGQPCLAGLHGPMWGGTDTAGSPILRYEAPAAHDMLSR